MFFYSVLSTPDLVPYYRTVRVLYSSLFSFLFLIFNLKIKGFCFQRTRFFFYVLFSVFMSAKLLLYTIFLCLFLLFLAPFLKCCFTYYGLMRILSVDILPIVVWRLLFLELLFINSLCYLFLLIYLSWSYEHSLLGYWKCDILVRPQSIDRGSMMTSVSWFVHHNCMSISCLDHLDSAVLIQPQLIPLTSMKTSFYWFVSRGSMRFPLS